VDEDVYFRCRTCGEYFLKSEAVNEVFCSNLCAKNFTRCRTCGKYFTKTYKDDPPYCSDKCSKNYTELIKNIKIENNNGEFV
jgi:hypothetical protein